MRGAFRIAKRDVFFNFAFNLCKKVLRRRFLAKCKKPRWQLVEMHFKTPKDGPKRPQDGPQMVPRWPKHGPKMALRRARKMHFVSQIAMFV